MSDDRKLLPELLPAPSAKASASPKERVAERARVLLDRFRGLGTSAGAAMLAVHCSGYQVVDPLPNPAHCSADADPFDGIYADATAIHTPSEQIVVYLRDPYLFGLAVADVRVSAGTLITSEDRSSQEEGASFAIHIAPPAPPAELVVEIDLSCDESEATRRYRVVYPTNEEGTLEIEEL